MEMMVVIKIMLRVIVNMPDDKGLKIWFNSKNRNLSAVMIFFIPDNTAGPVNLFGQYQSHQLMRERECRKRPFEFCLCQYSFIQSEGAAYQKYQTLNAFIPPVLNETGKFLRGQAFPVFIQRHQPV